MNSALEYSIADGKLEVDVVANREESSGLVSFNCLGLWPKSFL